MMPLTCAALSTQGLAYSALLMAAESEFAATLELTSARAATISPFWLELLACRAAFKTKAGVVLETRLGN